MVGVGTLPRQHSIRRSNQNRTGVIATPWDVREDDGKFCVYKKGSDTPVAGGCHGSRADAVKHQRALYAAESSSMKYSALVFSDDLLVDTPDENVKWLMAWRYSTWNHPKYGEVSVTPELGARFREHFINKTLGRDHLVNYEHGADAAKGGKAGGVVLDIEPREKGIYYKVQFTENARKEIEAGEWRYLSPEFDDWLNPETGEIHEDVPFDLALTNTPFFKGMPPLNFSELYTEDDPPPKPKDTKGGNKVDELLKRFAEKLGVKLEDGTSEEDVLKAAEELNKTIEPLRRSKDEGERTRTFREAFPDQYEKIKKLEAAQIETDATQFAESYGRFTVKDGENEWKSVLGFSEVVKDKIAEVHKKFSERIATHEDLQELLDLIGDKGIVDYSEMGSGRTKDSKPLSEDPKQAFSEVVTEIQDKDNLEYEAAIHIASKKFPELYEAYVRAIPQR